MKKLIPWLYADIRTARTTHRGSTPDKNVAPKSYPRMEKVRFVAIDREATINNAEHEIGLETLGEVLRAASSAHDTNGTESKLPRGLELYVFPSSETQGCIYHYVASEHALETLWPIPRGWKSADMLSEAYKHNFDALLVITARWPALLPEYGDFALLQALFETGAVAQKIITAAQTSGLRAKTTLHFDDSIIIDSLDIDSEDEQPLALVTLTKPFAPRNSV